MKEIDRREFLKLGAIVTVGKLLPPVESFLPEESHPEILPFEEILKNHKEINPKITAVNLSCIPDRFVDGQKTDFHDFRESLGMTIPYREIVKAGELSIYGYAPGLKEAVKRGQTVFFVVENPPSPGEYDPQSWKQGMEKVAEHFQGASIFIIGNEINTHYSPWRNSLDKYQKIYLAAYQAIKAISPKSSVFPWQEAYYGHGEVLEEFLAKKEMKDKIDGLAFNFYDVSEKLGSKVDLYRQILKRHGLSHLPVIISELGKPGGSLTQEQQACLVVQNLATAAYLEKQGKIDLSAWFCAYSGPDNEHALSFSNNREFEPKPALFAFLLAQRLLAGDEINLKKNPLGFVEVTVSNRGRPSACFVWNEGEKVIPVPPKWGCQQIWTPDGKKLFPLFPVTLRPSTDPSVYPGEAAVFVF